MNSSSPGAAQLKDGIWSLSYKGVDYIKTDRVLFAPAFLGKDLCAPARTEVHKGRIRYKFDQGPLRELTVFTKDHGRYVEMYSRAVVGEDVTLTDWHVFGRGGNQAGFDQIVVANSNIRGRMTSGVFDRLRLSDQMTRVTHTMGLGIPSWFFPLPVNYMLATYHELLFLGLDDVYDFSEWTIRYEGTTITDWRLEYGRHLKFVKGQTITSPRWIGFFMDTDDPFAPWPVYTDILKSRGRIRNPHRDRPDWWANLNYVTWGDQHVHADGQKTQTYRQTETNLSEETVRRWIGIIEKYRLPFKTITIDGYWCGRIGEWRADPDRFPNLRGLVDDLHERGYKVLFWYCPFEADRTAPVFKDHPEYFVEETIPQKLFLEKAVALPVRPRFDYTHPQVRRFIRQDIRRILSPAPGCYNGDGLKLDFYGSAPNAKRVRAFHDPRWGLGHRFILKSHALIYRWAKAAKPDCRIDGENGNPFFVDYTDSLRAWDWCEPDYTIYNNRVKLASVLCPGVPALYDEHIHFKNLYKYCLRSAVARPIFFNVECFHGDMHKPTDREYRILAEILDVVADLNRRARDVQPPDMDEGTIHDWHGHLIGKVAPDDTWLIAANLGNFDVVLLNDTDTPRIRGAVIDPREFGVKAKPFVVKGTIPAFEARIFRRRNLK